jgi:hypothetical protein
MTQLSTIVLQVTVRCWARVPSTTGRQGEGVPYFQTSDAETLIFTMGEGRVPPGLEEGVGSLAKGERAFVSCPADSARGGTLVPDPPADVDRVKYEMELVSMLQVRVSDIFSSSLIFDFIEGGRPWCQNRRLTCVG